MKQSWKCDCGFSVNVEARDFPLHCLCGRVVQAMPDNLPAAGKSRHHRPAPAGPGAELALLLAELGIAEKIGCRCKQIAAAMNQAGAAGCRARRDEFLAKLGENAKHYSWLEKLAAANAAWVQGLPLSLGGMFDEAIRRAEAKQTPCAADIAAALAPAWRHRFPTGALLLADHCLNPSVWKHQGRVYMAYRRGIGNARIALAELAGDTPAGLQQILWQRELALPLVGMADRGHEDPRLFTFQGVLHVAYTGCTRQRGETIASVCYARLGDDGSVQEAFQPQFPGRRPQEKNWSFFEHAGVLHAVYAISGQRTILRIDGDRATVAQAYPQTLEYAGGEPRGGASPVLHRGEWYAFFHGVIGTGAERIYTAGLHTFETQPPFRIMRRIRLPVMIPQHADRPSPKLPHCVYPAGAMLGSDWIVSLGYYDRWCELAAFPAADIETHLEAV